MRQLHAAAWRESRSLVNDRVGDRSEKLQEGVTDVAASVARGTKQKDTREPVLQGESIYTAQKINKTSCWIGPFSEPSAHHRLPVIRDQPPAASRRLRSAAALRRLAPCSSAPLLLPSPLRLSAVILTASAPFHRLRLAPRSAGRALGSSLDAVAPTGGAGSSSAPAAWAPAHPPSSAQWQKTKLQR